MTQNCGDPNCKDCNPVKPIVKRTIVLNAFGEEVGFAEPPIPDGQGGFFVSMMLTEREDSRDRKFASIDDLIASLGPMPNHSSAIEVKERTKPVVASPKRLRITNRREVVTYGLRNRYNPCSVCGKPTRSVSDSRGPLCAKCSKG
jgi:hypothetical protein